MATGDSNRLIPKQVQGREGYPDSLLWGTASVRLSRPLDREGLCECPVPRLTQ